MVLKQFGARFRALGWVLGLGLCVAGPGVSPPEGAPPHLFPFFLHPSSQGSLSEADLDTLGQPQLKGSCTPIQSMAIHILAQKCSRSRLERDLRPCPDFPCHGSDGVGQGGGIQAPISQE